MEMERDIALIENKMMDEEINEKVMEINEEIEIEIDEQKMPDEDEDEILSTDSCYDSNEWRQYRNNEPSDKSK